MDLKHIGILIIIQILVQIINADEITDIKYPRNEFNSNDSSISVLSSIDLKKELKKDLKKEAILKEVQNENLKLLNLSKEVQKEIVKNHQKDSLPQRDNSKATSQKEDKLEKLKNNNKEQHVTLNNKQQDITKKDSATLNITSKPQNTVINNEYSHIDLADLFIGTITNSKMGDFHNSTLTSNSKQSSSSNSTSQNSSTGSSTLDDLRIKVIEQVHLKAKIFFQVFSQAFSSNQLFRESVSSFIKNKNDGLSNKINSIYSSTPFLKPFQANVRPVSPTNSNNWCSSLSNSFQQYSQLNAFLLAAFLLFPVTIPFYLLGWLVLFLTRSLFCIGAKQIVTNIIYRIRSN